MTGTGEAVVFWVLSCIAVPGALALLFARKAVHAAIGMVTTMIVLGVFYLLQEADFLGVVHIFVYTGAAFGTDTRVRHLIGLDPQRLRTRTGAALLTGTDLPAGTRPASCMASRPATEIGARVTWHSASAILPDAVCGRSRAKKDRTKEAGRLS